jgi:hypothetical protein
MAMSQERSLATWVTFAPVEPHWIAPRGVELPYQFSEGLSYRLLPDWIWEESGEDGFRSQLRDKIDRTQPHCIAAEYQAEGLSTEQVVATQKIFSAHLALWFAHATALSFGVMVHAGKYGEGWLTRQIMSYNPARPLPEYEGESFTAENFEQAKYLILKMERLPKNGTVYTALAATRRALVEGSWELRYLLYWLAMESLFGPEDGREIAFRLSQRVALFLEEESTKAQDVFKQVKEGYRWRSKIVHGLRVSKPKEGEVDKLLSELEGLLRRVLVATLSEETTAEMFDGKGREEFLDGLAFK